VTERVGMKIHVEKHHIVKLAFAFL